MIFSYILSWESQNDHWQLWQSPAPMVFDSSAAMHKRIDDYMQWPVVVEHCEMTGHYAWPAPPPTARLRQFYQELQAWIEDGRPEHPAFDSHIGICANLDNWSSADAALSHALIAQFNAAGLDPTYPFNTQPDTLSYAAEGRIHSTYHNPYRLAWIEEHAA